MAEALDAMVKAMLQELRNQAADEVRYVSDDARPWPLLDGRFDLEKVARAALLAIKNLTADVQGEDDESWIYLSRSERAEKQREKNAVMTRALEVITNAEKPATPVRR